MTALLLRKEDWVNFTAALIAGEHTVWAPAERGGVTRYIPLAEGVIPELLPQNCTISPKEIFFPQTETFFKFPVGKTVGEQPVLERKMVLLGVRPCDGRALALQDKLFLADTGDPYYARRRELTTVIGQACREPGLNCFCTSVGGSPASTEGLDLLLHELEEAYLVEIITGKGRALLEELQGYLEEVPAEARRAAARTAKETAARMKRLVDTSVLPEGLPRLWEHPLWQRVAASCLGCGICTYLCPTCHCFDIQDEVEGFQGRRYRCWDSCMFEEYTRHASGHNPRPSRRERVRNRINHKYSYFVEKFGVIGCVGCGRCIDLCPVNIDLMGILRQVKEALSDDR